MAAEAAESIGIIRPRLFAFKSLCLRSRSARSRTAEAVSPSNLVSPSCNETPLAFVASDEVDDEDEYELRSDEGEGDEYEDEDEYDEDGEDGWDEDEWDEEDFED